MLKDLKNTIRQSAVYGLTRVAAKSVSFILIPLYTAKFTADGIANINLLEALWQYLFIICMFAFETAIIFFCASEKNISRRKTILFNFLILTVFNSAVLLMIGGMYSDSISLMVLKDIQYSDIIYYCFLISIFESLLVLPMTISRLNEKPSLYIIISISNLGINLLLQLYFIVIKNYDFGYVFLAKTIAPAVIFIIFIPYVIKNIFAKINFEDVKSILKFSFPLMLAALLSIMLNTFDRFILTYFVSKEEIAIYTTGYSIGSMTNAFILAPFTLAFNMIFWKKIEEVNFRRFMTKSSTYLFFSMIIISLIITYFLPYAIRIFVRNEALWSAENVIPFILFANCFVALFIFPSHDFYYRKTTSKILIIIAICLIFNFIANVIFINYFGIYASAVITVLSFILMISLGYLITKKYSFTKFESRKIILLSVMFVIFASYVYAVSISNVYLDVIIKLLLIFLFLIILHKVNFFEPIETERIRGFFNKYLFSKLR